MKWRKLGDPVRFIEFDGSAEHRAVRSEPFDRWWGRSGSDSDTQSEPFCRYMAASPASSDHSI